MNKEEIKNIINKTHPTIFEIGCANGQDTTEFINNIPDAKFFCFEPEPKNIKLFKDNINYDNVFLFEGVVSDVDGEVLFNRSRVEDPNALSLSGSIKAPQNHQKIWPHILFDKTITVLSTTLDTFCELQCIKKIDFIWMDVQGAEDNVFRGAKNMLKNIKYIFTEYSDIELYKDQKNLNQLLELLNSDWKLIKNTGPDVLLENTKYVSD